jgi:hypothetical protein
MLYWKHINSCTSALWYNADVQLCVITSYLQLLQLKWFNATNALQCVFYHKYRTEIYHKEVVLTVLLPTVLLCISCVRTMTGSNICMFGPTTFKRMVKWVQLKEIVFIYEGKQSQGVKTNQNDSVPINTPSHTNTVAHKYLISLHCHGKDKGKDAPVQR